MSKSDFFIFLLLFFNKLGRNLSIFVTSKFITFVTSKFVIFVTSKFVISKIGYSSLKTARFFLKLPFMY